MYQALVYFTLLALCAARSIPVPMDSAYGFQQQDQSDVIDNLGAGYSFFGRQDIIPRPTLQQRITINEPLPQGPNYADNSNQWSDLRRPSALLNPQTSIFVSSKPVGGGFEQPQLDQTRFISNGFEQRPPPFLPPVTRVITDSYNQPAPPTYGPASDDSYDQGRTLTVLRPTTRVISGGYGGAANDDSYNQGRTLTIVRPTTRVTTSAFSQPAPLAPRVIASGYGQPAPPVTTVVTGGFSQPAPTTFTSVASDDSYGEQRTLTFLPPTTRVVTGGYSQPAPPATTVITGGYGQPAPLTFGGDDSKSQRRVFNIFTPSTRVISNGYSGAPSDDSYGEQRTLTFLPPTTRVVTGGYSQPAPPATTVITGGYSQPAPTTFVGPANDDSYSEQRTLTVLRPTTRVISGGYGGDDSYNQGRTLTILPPTTRVVTGGYSQPTPPATTVITGGYSQPAPTTFVGPANDDSYSEQRTLTVLRPTTRVISGGYGGDDSYNQGRTLTILPPATRVVTGGYSQPAPLAPRVVTGSYSQPAPPNYGDFISDDNYGQQKSITVLQPSTRLFVDGYGQQQQQQDFSSMQVMRDNYGARGQPSDASRLFVFPQPKTTLINSGF